MKYKSAIAERMKERQIESGVAFGRGGKGSDQMNHTFEKTTKRKELAKIAGTSEGSIKQKKLPHGVASFVVPMPPI